MGTADILCSIKIKNSNLPAQTGKHARQPINLIVRHIRFLERSGKLNVIDNGLFNLLRLPVKITM